MCARVRTLVFALVAVAIASGDALAYFQSAQPQNSQPASTGQAASSGQAATKISPEQLDSLVAPIALYPDPLLAQTLAASTYPLEIVALQQWLKRNPTLKDKALLDAVAKQPWDDSVKAMAPLPDVVKRLADDIQWTTDLGNAFLAQQSDVMDAVQRMRKKALDKGTLKSGEQQKVETKVVESKSVIVIEQSNPQVVYVPSYDPVVVYGAAVYPYPAIYYPPYYGGYYPGAAFVSFSFGVAMGAMWAGAWGYGCGWGHGDIDVDIDRNVNRNVDRSRNNNRTSNRSSGRSSWQHNPQHRGGAPYSDRATANKYGGTARGDSLGQRQAGARQQIGRSGGRYAGYSSGGGLGGGGLGGGGLGGGAGVGGNRSAFGSGNYGGYSGSSARSSSSRGSSSMGYGGSRGGGYSGGGRSGGYGGGGRSGGGGGGFRGGGRR
jgi:hypothetical protein